MNRVALACLTLGILAGGCATVPPPLAVRVVLLPNEDGRPSAVVVTPRRGDRPIELKQAYGEARVSGPSISAGQTTAEAVRDRYATLLSVQPPRLRSYTLYFEYNRAVLTQASQREVDRILGEAELVPAAEIEVIGHTDTRGGSDYNDQLGRTRAQSVADIMQFRGFSRQRLSVQTRGERELLVSTPDETEEPRNRRVEIRLR